MRTWSRVIVGFLAVLGVVALSLVVVVVVMLRAGGPVDLGAPPPTPAPASPTAGGPAGQIIADSLTAEVTVPFATLQAQAGPGVTMSDAGGGLIRVSVPVRALGRDFRATTEGDMSVDGSDVVVHPQAVSIEGLPALDGLLSVLARQAAGVRAPITGIPAGVTVQSVTSTPAGVRARVTGAGVPLPQA